MEHGVGAQKVLWSELSWERQLRQQNMDWLGSGRLFERVESNGKLKLDTELNAQCKPRRQDRSQRQDLKPDGNLSPWQLLWNA